MNKKLLICFVMWVMGLTAFAQETLTVYEGTATNNTVPAYVFYWDDFTRCEFVIPASELADMEGGTITALKFYTTDYNVPYTSVSQADFYLKEVDFTTISAYETKETSTIVYSGTIDVVAVDGGGEVTITFSTPYTYEGGNLLIGSENTTDAGFKSIYFKGQNVNGASISGYNSSDAAQASANQRNFIPQTTFTYTPGGGPVYAKPKNLQVDNIGTTTADLTWEAGANETSWNVEYKKATDTEWTAAGTATEMAYTLESLDAGTEYAVRVNAVYADGISGWVMTTFTTVAADAMPTDVEVDNITATTADVNVEGVQETYNIRYRIPAVYSFYEDFETMTTGSNPPEGWTMIDADGDGNLWYGWNPVAYGNPNNLDGNGNPTTLGDGCLTSASYLGGALNPDNWLITPQVELGGTLSMWYRGQDPGYPAEHFMVYVSVGDPTDTNSFVAVTEETVAGTTYQELTADLSEYEGQMGYIAIRHFNCSDEFRLNIDNVAIIEQPAGEWTTVEGVEVPYTIEGLDPETDYELQVQGIIGDATTDWTESVFFTTAAPEPEEGFFLVGDFNGWNQTAEGGRLTFDENGKIEGAEFEAGAEFKVIAFDEDGSTIWFGGQDDNNVGFFLINNELLGQNIMCVEGVTGANFRIEEAGNYNLQLDFLRDFNGAVLLTVTKNSPEAISTVGVDGYDNNAWYNLNGQKLNGKPVVPGIYINGNKKVIIK